MFLKKHGQVGITLLYGGCHVCAGFEFNMINDYVCKLNLSSDNMTS